MEKQKGAKKGIIAVGIIAVAVIAVLVGVIVYLVHGMQQTQNVEEEEREIIVREDNVEEVVEQLEKQAENQIAPPPYMVIMSDEWDFADGLAISDNAYVENSELNANMVYFVVTLDSGEEVYRSAYMELGSYLDKIKLDKELTKGEYDAEVTYYLVDDDFNDLSQVSVKITITIEN